MAYSGLNVYYNRINIKNKEESLCLCQCRELFGSWLAETVEIKTYLRRGSMLAFSDEMELGVKISCDTRA